MVAGEEAQKNANLSDRIIWVDCEMTGLDIDKNRLVEIACIVTDGQLKQLAEFGPVAIQQPPEVMQDMSEWCQETFAKNGLLERIKTSEHTEQAAEQMVLDFLREHTEKGKCPMAGNSIHMDRVFISRYMPKLADHFHYRSIDVSTIKELTRRWYSPEELNRKPEKQCTHLALDDIRESIAELTFYKDQVFRHPGEFNKSQ
ncbi:oligoribonuclease [Aphelenchoides avenae]|nr:oligoribonuclease [Aphelenchus avenae]